MPATTIYIKGQPHIMRDAQPQSFADMDTQSLLLNHKHLEDILKDPGHVDIWLSAKVSLNLCRQHLKARGIIIKHNIDSTK